MWLNIKSYKTTLLTTNLTTKNTSNMPSYIMQFIKRLLGRGYLLEEPPDEHCRICSLRLPKL